MDWKVSDQDPHPRPFSQPGRHVPGETVDLLHVEATGGAVSQCQCYEVEVIERGPGPGTPLLAGGLPEPPTLEGGPFVRESHRGAVMLVLSLLLFCELEEYRVGTVLAPWPLLAAVAGRGRVQGYHLDWSPTQGHS